MGEFQPTGKYRQGQYGEFENVDEFKDKLRRDLARCLPTGGQTVTPAQGGFDFDGYRLRFGYERKWVSRT